MGNTAGISGLGIALAVAATVLVSGTAKSAAACAPPPSASGADGSPIVIGCSFEIPSRVLGDTRRINVYLPEHYGDANRTFSVLYLLDGGIGEDFLHIAGLAQISAAYGNGQELIVVGIQGVDRRHDLTSPSTDPADRKLLPTSGGAGQYRKFLAEEVKPWVAAHYRSNGHSAVIGESLAGLFALETLFDEPKTFDDYIVVSPSLWWRGGAVAAGAEALLSRAHFSGQRLFLAFDDPPPPADKAEKDRVVQDRLEAAFRISNPAGITWHIVRPGEGHATIYHPAALLALRWLYGAPPSAQ